MSCPVTEPPWLADLPRFGTHRLNGTARARRHQQLPMLAAATPWTAAHNTPRTIALAFRRRCAFCGCVVPEGHYWKVDFYSPQEEHPVRHPGGVVTSLPPGPIMHKSCAVYAGIVCPFLKYPTSRRPPPRRSNTRGDVEISRYNRYGIAFFGKTSAPYNDNTPWNDEDRFGYLDRVERITYQTWRDLLPAYEDIVAADAKVTNTSTRMYWTDSEADRRDLAQYARQDNIRLAALRATALTHVRGYNYRLALL